jgi:hypothetical protein
MVASQRASHGVIWYCVVISLCLGDAEVIALAFAAAVLLLAFSLFGWLAPVALFVLWGILYLIQEARR